MSTAVPGVSGPAYLDRTPRRAWLVWGVGVAAYVVAVFHRGSLGVAAIDAEHRFGVSPALLSLFSVLQLAVYAAMQIPVGTLLDRFGSRRMILTGAALMAVGQVALATAHHVPTAIAARVLVGGGDAMTFISVLRLVPMWFAPRQIPLVTQLTGVLGQIGQIAATYPLVALLHHVGWTASYAGAAGVSVLVALLVASVMRDPPATGGRRPALRPHLVAAWREHGTRIGLWTHFVTQFSGTVFALLWGYPFLVKGEGLSPSTAGVLLTLLVLAGIAVAPLLGRLTGRWPLRRSALTLTIVGSSALMWTVVLVWPGRCPLAVLVLLVLVLGTNGPGSMVGFDYARTFNPPLRLGSASGIVNVGGFVASLTTILVIGIVLDLAGHAGLGSLDGYRAAFATQYVLWGAGLLGVLHNRRILRRRIAAEGTVIRPLPLVIRDRLRR